MSVLTLTMIDPVTILNELLDDELNSPLRFLKESTPYLSPDDAALWPQLKRMGNTQAIRAATLIKLIDHLDGDPAPTRPMREEQYLAFLSLDYLKPRLIDWKNRTILRHERALMLLESADERILRLIANHLQQHRQELDVIAGG